jgi:hypothetical protein
VVAGTAVVVIGAVVLVVDVVSVVTVLVVVVGAAVALVPVSRSVDATSRGATRERRKERMGSPTRVSALRSRSRQTAFVSPEWFERHLGA